MLLILVRLQAQQLSVSSSADSDNTPGAVCVCEADYARRDVQGGNDIKRRANKEGYLYRAQ